MYLTNDADERDREKRLMEQHADEAARAIIRACASAQHLYGMRYGPAQAWRVLMDRVRDLSLADVRGIVAAAPTLPVIPAVRRRKAWL